MADKAQQYYTQEGLNDLKKELEYLKNVRRAEVVHDIEVARGFGDLSENSEYDEARTEQAKVEARIKELEYKLEHAVVIDESQIDLSLVSVGSTVGVEYKGGPKTTLIIVGANETNPGFGRISDMSPIGKALIGKKEGDTVTVETPSGEKVLTILSVARTKNN